MTRQYIGARYVPKIYTNTQNPSTAEWESNTVYEPLTIVTYNTGSYISRKEVPNNIGNPANNSEYWALTGAYNGQINALQQQLAEINEQIGDENSGIIGDIADLNTLVSSVSMWHNKNVVVYGDSLSAIDQNYWQYMVELDPTITISNRAVSGTRIADGLSLLQNASDLGEYDIVVLAYGTNSWSNSPLREMVNTYVSCFNIISSRAPAAEIVCIAPFYSYRPNWGASSINDIGFGIYDYCSAIVNICTMYGGKAFNLYELTGVNQYNYTYYLTGNSQGVYQHENEILARRIARILLTATPATIPVTSYNFYQLGDDTNTGLIIVKMNNMTFIYQRGNIAVDDLLALSLANVAPAFTVTGFARGRTNQNMCYVALSSSGTFNISWNGGSGNADTEIQGLSMFGIFSQIFQPH